MVSQIAVTETHGLMHPLMDQVVRMSHQLFEIPERGDRLLAATAMALELPLMTRDPEIAACAGVALVW